MSKRRIVMAACGILMAVAVWAQGVVVCRACGREAKPGATACAHCSVALPKPREPEAAAPAPAVDPAAEVSKAATAVTANSLRQARELEGKSGAYLGNCAVEAPAPCCADAALAARLWDVTEQVLDRIGA